MVGLAMMHAEGSRAQGCSEFGEARVLRPSLLPRWLGLVWAVVRSYAQTAPAFACVRASSDPSTVRVRSVSCAARSGHGCPLGNAAHLTQGAHSSRRSIRTPQGVDRGAVTLCCFAAHKRRRLPRPPSMAPFISGWGDHCTSATAARLCRQVSSQNATICRTTQYGIFLS